jgi:hypothetical protein
MKTTILGLLCILSAALSAGESFLTDGDVELFHRQGYLIKRQCFSLEEVEKARNQSSCLLDSLFGELAKETYPYSNNVQEVYLKGSKVDFRKEAGKELSIFKVVGCGAIEPEFNALLRSDKILNTFFQLLESTEIEQIICQFHPKLPGDRIAFPPHRDVTFRRQMDPNWEDINGNGSYAIMTLALDRSSPENGGICIDLSTYPSEKGEDPQIIGPVLYPGDVLFMHPEILHWSNHNDGETPRRTLLAGFCAFGANHVSYPGDLSNDVFTKESDGSIHIKKAPWKFPNRENP